MTDLRVANRFFGYEIQRHPNGGYSLNQRTHIDNMLQLFQMVNAYTKIIPADPHVNLSKYADIDKPIDQRHHPSITASLSYAPLGTRPGIASIVANLAQYNTDPRSVHLMAAKRVLQYLKKTENLRLHFKPNPSDSNPSNSPLIRYTDADRGKARAFGHQ